MNPINTVNFPAISMPNMGEMGKASGNGEDFKNFLLESIGHVNNMQQDADKAVEQLVTGGEANMAEVLTMVQKADMSFRMMMQVRNKLMQAYQEIKDIRV